MQRNEVIGQQEIWNRLMEMVQENRLPHALMFCGPQGCGKLAMALAFASYLLGDSPMLRKWEHPDLHFTFPTIKTANMGSEHKPVSLDFIKEWRELLLSKGPYIQISDWMLKMGKTDADYNKQAIITAEETDAISHELMMLEPDMAHRIARIANGNWNLALEELDAGNENRQHLDMFIMLMRLAYMRKIGDLKKWTDVIATFGREKQKRMLDYFMHMLRESFMYNFRNPELSYMTQDEENFAKNFARFINEANIIDISNLFEDSKRMISQNANAKIVFFDMALKIIVLLLRK